MEGIMKENEQAVHVIYASNDGYAGHLAASLCSLLDNNRHINDLDIYVLSAQMCEAFKERLKNLAAGFGRRLYAVELGDLKERFPYKIDTRGFDISAWGGFLRRRYCRRLWIRRCTWTVIPLSALPLKRCTGHI